MEGGREDEEVGGKVGGKKEQFVSIIFHFIPFRWHEILINCQMSVMLTSCFMTESVNVTLRRLFALRTSGQVGVAGDWLLGGTLVGERGRGRGTREVIMKG